MLVYRFHHHLVRDTVYNGLLKRARATLHVDFVRGPTRSTPRATAARSSRRSSAITSSRLTSTWVSSARSTRPGSPSVGTGQGGWRARDGARSPRGDMHAACQPAPARVAPCYSVTTRPCRAAAGTRRNADGRGRLRRRARRCFWRLEACRATRQTSGSRRRASSSACSLRLVSGEQARVGDETHLRRHPNSSRCSSARTRTASWRPPGGWSCSSTASPAATGWPARPRALDQSRADSPATNRLVAQRACILAITRLLGSTPVPQAIAQCEELIADGLSDRQVECNVM